MAMRVGFVCGAWDLLHPGHLMLLKDARGHCDRLIVGLHIDPSLERPEKNKPVESVKERVMRLEACRWVDGVERYATEADLLAMLKRLAPDVRFLGTDYKYHCYTGQELGIPIHWHERNHSHSTSRLRKRIIEAAR